MKKIILYVAPLLFLFSFNANAENKIEKQSQKNTEVELYQLKISKIFKTNKFLDKNPLFFENTYFENVIPVLPNTKMNFEKSGQLTLANGDSVKSTYNFEINSLMPQTKLTAEYFESYKNTDKLNEFKIKVDVYDKKPAVLSFKEKEAFKFCQDIVDTNNIGYRSDLNCSLKIYFDKADFLTE